MVVQSLIRDCLAQRTFWFRFIFLGLFVPCSLLVFPNRVAAVTFSAEVDRSRLSPGDQLTLKVTLEGSVQSLPTAELPTLNGVEVYTGGTSQNFSFINGKTSLSVTTTYYLVVRTDRSFEIPALEVEVQGQTYRTQPIPIQVIPTTSAPRGGDRPDSSSHVTPSSQDNLGTGPAESIADSRTTIGGRPGDEIFITLSTDKSRAYVGEQIMLTFRFHRRIQLWDSPQYTAPRTEGFWREDMPPERTFVRSIAGYRYNVTELRYALFPTRPGRLTISPAEVTIPVDVFDRFFSRRRRDAGPQRLRTNSLELEVSTLPTPRPDTYSGVVASQLTLRAVVDRDSVPRGEPVSLKINITANAFLKSFAGLSVHEPATARMHDAVQNLSVDKSGEHLLSHYSVEKVLVPTEEGVLRLDPVQITYFDPAAGQYKTASRAGSRIVVIPSDLPVAGDGASGFLRSEIERIGRDLAFIHPVTTVLRTRRVPFPASYVWWIVLLTPLLLLVLMRWQLNRLEKLRRDPLGLRRRRALAAARHQLKAAAKVSERSAILARLAKAVHTFVADWTGRQAAALSTPDVRRFAEDLNLPMVAERLVDILTLCDSVRFGSAPSKNEDIGQLLQETESLLQELEKAGLRAKSRSRTSVVAPLLILGCIWLQHAVAPAQENPQTGPPPSLSTDPARLLAEGNQAYTAGDVPTATARYQEALALGVNDAVLHYNLGNAYAREGKLGRAILGYLRAQRLTPRDPDIRSNLAWVRSHIKDLELETRQMPPVIAILVLALNSLSLDEWSLLLIIFVWVLTLLVALAWYRGRVSDGLRRFLLAVASVLVLTVAVTSWRWFEEQIRDQAVVVVPEVEVRSGPADSFPVVFRIHDGLTLTIREQREDWLRIGLGGDWIGWVPAGSVESVRLPSARVG